MTTGFEMHGIEHLSASSLNTWVGQPSLWVMERLIKKSSSVGAAAHRGTAIEHGIELGLFRPDADVKECQDAAVKEFNRLTPLSGDVSRDKERAILADAVDVGLQELRQYGPPTKPENGRQHRISVALEGIPVPFLGFLDFLWEDHGLFLDLKTEHRLSSQIKSGHARQIAIYQAAKPNHEGRVAYVTPKKCGVYRLEPELAAKALNEISQIAARLERFLRISSDPYELAGLLCPEPDSFYWNSQQAAANRRQVYGY